MSARGLASAASLAAALLALAPAPAAAQVCPGKITIPDGQASAANPLAAASLFGTVGITNPQVRVAGPASDSFDGAAVDARWAKVDVGGNATQAPAISSRNLVVYGKGAGIAAASDAFTFVYQSVTGDFTADVYLESIDGWMSDAASAGLMVRASTAVGAGFAAIQLTPSWRGISFQVRSANGGTAASTQIPSVTGPLWLRLVRTGSSVSAFYSGDGLAWTQVGAAQTVSALPALALLGPAVTASAALASETSGTYDHFTVFQSPQSAAWTAASTSLSTAGWAPGSYWLEVRGTDVGCQLNLEMNRFSWGPSVTTPGTATAVEGTGATPTISVTAPYSNDSGTPNAANTLSYRHRTPSGTGTWSAPVSLAHSASPYAFAVGGLACGADYDVEVTYADADGVAPTRVQTVTGVHLGSCTAPGTPTAAARSCLRIEVSAPFTQNANGDGSTRVARGSSAGGPFADVSGCTAVAGSSPRVCLDGGVTGSQTYYHQLTWSDPQGVSTPTQVVGPTTTPACPPFAVLPGAVSATATNCDRVIVSATFSNDGNENSSTAFQRGPTSTGTWAAISGCTGMTGPSPRICIDTGTGPNAIYYYRATFSDPDNSPEPTPIVSGAFTTPRCANVLALSDPGQPAAGTIAIGGGPAIVGKVRFTASAGTVTLTSLGIRNGAAASPASASDIQSLALVDDQDGSTLAVSSWDGSRHLFPNLSLDVAAGTPRTFRVLATATNGAAIARAFAMRTAVEDMTVASPEAAGGAGFTGATFTIAGPASASEGDPARNSTKPMVSILSPLPGGAVSGTFRVQVQVYSPTAGGTGDVTAVQLSTDAGATWRPDAFTRLSTYAVGAKASVYELRLSLAPGSYGLRARAANGTGTVQSALAVVTVGAARRGDGNLLVRDNSSQLCTDCHAQATHSSQTTADERTGLSRYGSWATTCRDCHTPHDTGNLYLVRESMTPPAVNGYQTSRPVRFLDATTGDSGTAANVSFVTGDASKLSTGAGPCQTCHTRTGPPGVPRWRNTGNSDVHFDGASTASCTGCHLHSDGFTGREGTGERQCSACHGATWMRMSGQITDGVASAHRLAPTRGTTDAFADSGPTWGSPLGSVAEAQRSCVNMCHQDHRHNQAGNYAGDTHSFSAHQDASTSATRAVTRTPSFDVATGTPTSTDFSGSAANGGLCVSCHRNPIAAGRATVTRDAYAASAHNYVGTEAGLSAYGAWRYTLHDGSTFARNCTKCHATPADEQDQRTWPFGAVHASPNPSLLAGPVRPGDEGPVTGTFVCYQCHGNGSTGANRSGKDVVSAMQRGYGHPVSADAVHSLATEGTAAYQDGKFGGANRHVNCGDCHDPHEAGKVLHVPGAATIAANSPIRGITGVAFAPPSAAWAATASANLAWTASATREYEICFKCHSSFAFDPASPPTGVSGKAETDVARELNPNNRSYHPVVAPIPWSNASATTGSSRLTYDPNQVRPEWRAANNLPSKQVTCSDCHGIDDPTGLQGPHGSSVRFILKGAVDWSPNGGGLRMVYWPANPQGQLYTLGQATTTDAHLAGLFCRNCHGLRSSTAATWYNRVHQEHGVTQSSAFTPCVSCHIVVPHGGKVSRLIATDDPAAPEASRIPRRYVFAGDRGVILNVKFVKSATGSYAENSCQASTLQRYGGDPCSNGTDRHMASTLPAGAESWQ